MRRGRGGAIDEREIEDAFYSGVAVQGANVVGGGQSEAFVGLGHQVADIDLDRGGVHHGLGNSGDQQVGNEAGEERTGADGDQVGAGHRFQSLGQRLDVGRIEKQLLDAAAAGGDLVSPRTLVPSSIRASSSTCEVVAG